MFLLVCTVQLSRVMQREQLRKPLVGKHQLKQEILPETEFTYVIPCMLDNLINICTHEKLSPKAGNQKKTALQCVM